MKKRGIWRVLAGLLLLLLVMEIGCEKKSRVRIPRWVPYDQSAEIAENANHPSIRMRFRLIQSRVLDKNKLWDIIEPQLVGFSEEEYERLKPLILDQDIPTLQEHVRAGRLTYEKLTQWYLYQIVKFENDPEKYLNAIITINPNAVDEARERDRNRTDHVHPIYGMPVLVKDNINTEGMPTTAGAHLFLVNRNTPDAFIVQRIKEKGGIILGKTNLSEWANFLFLNGPNGFSAVGGQTLNPYGRKVFDTGGSSSGSGVAMAANYAAASIGTETSGSILSPSSKNSIVGLKPTTGFLSRNGIVPLSSTYDTPGPMTRHVIDAAILLSAMAGRDPEDPATQNSPETVSWRDITAGTLKGVRFGVMKPFLKDSVYRQTVQKIAALGGVLVEYQPPKIRSRDFGRVLRADMGADLPRYIETFLPPDFPYRTIEDILAYNRADSALRIPYGQARMASILDERISPEELKALKKRLRQEGRRFFEEPMDKYSLDVILSMDNRNARYAAMANFPCLTVPMGYRANGEPCGLTFVARSFEEEKLLRLAYAFERATKARKMPEGYR
jgi:amidase